MPVVIGAGQFTNREDDPEASPSPFDLLETVWRAAIDDAGGPAVGRRLDQVWVVQALSIRHGDPAGELMARLGVEAEGRYSGIGGNIPQWLLNRAADMVERSRSPARSSSSYRSTVRWRRVASPAAAATGFPLKVPP